MKQFNADGGTLRERCAHVRDECRKLKLSNEETDSICWLIDSEHASKNAAERPLHELKPLMADSRAEMLLDLIKAVGAVQPGRLQDCEFLHSFLDSHAHDQLDPQPLLDGGDLKEHGVEPGPQFKTLLNQIRNEQLDEKLRDREMALKRLSELLAE